MFESYLNGDNELFDIKAQKYADKVCSMDALFCASMSGLFVYKDRKLALKYAEKACEMGELADCVVAAELYTVGFGGVGKNPQKVKYYTDKLCKGGVSEACSLLLQGRDDEKMRFVFFMTMSKMCFILVCGNE